MGEEEEGARGAKKGGGGEWGQGGVGAGYKRLHDDCTTAQKAAEGGIPA